MNFSWYHIEGKNTAHCTRAEAKVFNMRDSVSSFNVLFESEETEQDFRAHYLKLHKQQLHGPWGSFSITSFITLMGIFSSYVNQFSGYLRGEAPGVVTFYRIFSLLPGFLFCLHHQWKVRSAKTLGEGQNLFHHSQSWAIQWFLYLCLTDLALAFVNESFPEYEGCKAKRFRCPETLTSSKFAARVFTSSRAAHRRPSAAIKGGEQYPMKTSNSHAHK